MAKFWNFVKNAANPEEVELRIEGELSAMTMPGYMNGLKSLTLPRLNSGKNSTNTRIRISLFGLTVGAATYSRQWAFIAP